jgi:Na+-translocating ferredoxin:NAD+ oxidoreductase RnfC subunit
MEKSGFGDSRFMTMIADLKEYGIVGAGGAGFPTYVKLGSPAEVLLVNAAECEPLLHKDKEILAGHTERFLDGLKICRELVGAKRCIIGIKKKYADLIQKLKSCGRVITEVFPLEDFYPAGDEITLIFETTGRVVPAGQLPLTQGVVVQNVETILNVGNQRPVTTKFLTIAGDVRNPVTLEVPVGTTFRHLMDQAGPLPPSFDVLVGGPMMGRLAESLDEPVTKTTGGLIVLPSDHELVLRYKTAAVENRVAAIGKSACDQCAMCTDLCPRYLLGHPIQPHATMRSLLLGKVISNADPVSANNLFCCECNLCSLISCPEGLYPAQACILKKKASIKDKVHYSGEAANRPHPLIAYRRIPMKKIMARLGLSRFSNKGPLMDLRVKPCQFRVKLCQHIGAPASALVKVGDRVEAAQKIATVGERLGAEIHSPVAGVVSEVTQRHILIDGKKR